MYLLNKFRALFRRLLQAYGTSNSKRCLWNSEFARGHWDYIDRTPGDCVYAHIERHAAGGSILDLGCGSGSTANELSAVSYRSYVGIDISDIAINQARGKTAGNARTNKARFHQGDIVNYGPSQQFDVILLRDSLYYLPLWKVKQILDRYSKYLAHDGVFVVRMAWSDKYTAIVKAIEMRFKLLEKQWYENPKAIVLVFR